MANTDAPRGFWPIRHLSGGQIRAKKYQLVNTNANLLTKGDVAKMLTTGYVDLAAADIGKDAIGVFAYFEWKDADGKFKAGKQMPATKTNFTALVAYVYDDPQIVFGCQSNGNTTFASVGDHANHEATAADTTRKISGHELDHASFVGNGNSAQFVVIGKIEEPSNDWYDGSTATTANVNLEVIFSEHMYKGGGVAV